jgi:transcriptional regulator with XRE-family HTH domain
MTASKRALREQAVQIDEGSVLESPGIERLGRTLRRLRRERGMSLQALADLADISVGMLSHIERGLSTPSLRSLSRIRNALGVPLSSLFEEDAASPARSEYVRRRGNRPVLDLGPKYLVKELLSPSSARDLQFMILTIPPGGGSGEQPFNSPGEKGGFMLQGSMRLEIGKDFVDIQEGDSVQFDSSIPHRFYNIGKTSAKVLWIIGQLPHERHL